MSLVNMILHRVREGKKTIEEAEQEINLIYGCEIDDLQDRVDELEQIWAGNIRRLEAADEMQAAIKEFERCKTSAAMFKVFDSACLPGPLGCNVS